MNQDDLKREAARAAWRHIQPHLREDMVIGVGTGSTTNHFIEELGKDRNKIAGTVASSESSAKKLQSFSIPVLDLNSVDEVAFYVDGADEANAALELIKGGGAALTREKIIAAVARQFLCIADGSKLVEVLGRFPLPVEVIPMARSHVAREIVKLGGDPVWREGCVTDNGNVILDVHNLHIANPKELEGRLNQITGVVTNGLFAQRPADLLFLAREGRVDCLRPDGR